MYMVRHGNKKRFLWVITDVHMSNCCSHCYVLEEEPLEISRHESLEHTTSYCMRRVVYWNKVCHNIATKFMEGIVVTGSQKIHSAQERPLRSPKVTVWCAVSSSRIIGPFFFERNDGETMMITVARFIRMMENLCLEIDCLENRGNIWFKQDGANAHTARISMILLREMFLGLHALAWRCAMASPFSRFVGARFIFMGLLKKLCVHHPARYHQGAEETYRRQNSRH